MSETNNPTVDAAARRLEQVRADMAAATRKMQARVSRFSIIAVVVAIFLGIYFTFLFTQIRGVNADMAVAAATDSIKTNYLGDVRTSLSTTLKERAPSVVAAGGDKLLEMPAAMKGMLSDFIISQMDKQLAQTRDEFYTTVKSQLGPIAQKVKDANPNATDDQRLSLIIDEVAKTYSKASQQQLDELYKAYSPRRAELSDYLQSLAKGENLTPKEQLHRKLVQTFLALMQKLENDGTATIVPVASN